MNGYLSLSVTVYHNDVPGLWRIHVQELASGLTADAYMRVAASNRQSIVPQLQPPQ